MFKFQMGCFRKLSVVAEKKLVFSFFFFFSFHQKRKVGESAEKREEKRKERRKKREGKTMTHINEMNKQPSP